MICERDQCKGNVTMQVTMKALTGDQSSVTWDLCVGCAAELSMIPFSTRKKMADYYNMYDEVQREAFADLRNDPPERNIPDPYEYMDGPPDPDDMDYPVGHLRHDR